MSRLCRIALLAAFLLAVAPTAASAATAWTAAPTLFFLAAENEENRLSVSLGGGVYTLTDTGGAPITAGANCTQVNPSEVTCPSGSITGLNLDARDGGDTITVGGGTPIATLSGGSGDDTLTGGDANDTLNGGPDSDRLVGGTGVDALNGDTGDDSLVGGPGNDVFTGGAGTDLADYSGRTQAVTISIDGTANDGQPSDGVTPAETDNVKVDVENVTGGSGNDTILGGTTSIINVLTGGAGDDSIDGEAANDTLDGGDGDDILAGGAGTDTVTYAGRMAPVTVTLDGLDGDGAAGEDDTVRTDVEAVIGGTAGDTLTGSALADTLSGGPGDDTLHGEAAADVLNGDAGDDLLEGGAGGDTHNGGAGADTADYGARIAGVTVDLDGAADDGETAEADNVRPDVERLLGGLGDDTLTGNNATNELYGGAGNDVLDVGRGTGDEAYGGADTDTVTYSTRSAPVTADLDGVADDGEAAEYDLVWTDVENLTGGSANDRLTGSAGTNVLNGGTGNDVLDGGAGSDLLVGGSGTDTADYFARTAAVTADSDGQADDGEAGENDTVETDVEAISGGAGADVLSGTTGTNILSGGGGNDVLDGAQGDDELDGGTGDDQLTGGSGADLLRAGLGNDTVRSRDGASDLVRCGGGTDSAVLDATDDVGECETTDVLSTAGPQGPAGPTGGTGGTGATGATGAAGATGPAGRDAVVTCVPGKAKGGKVKVTCSVKVASASAVSAVFRRGGRAVASRRGRVVSVRLARGRYRLVVRYGSKTVVQRLNVR